MRTAVTDLLESALQERLSRFLEQEEYFLNRAVKAANETLEWAWLEKAAAAANESEKLLKRLQELL